MMITCEECGKRCKKDSQGYHCLSCDIYYPYSYVERNKMLVKDVKIGYRSVEDE